MIYTIINKIVLHLSGSYKVADLRIIGILVMAILPNFLSGTKRSKAKKQKVLICKIIGWLLIFLGIYDALSVLLGA